MCVYVAGELSSMFDTNFIVICFRLCVWFVYLFILCFHHENQRTKFGRQVYLDPRELAFSLSDLRAGISYVWLEQLTSHVVSLLV